LLREDERERDPPDLNPPLRLPDRLRELLDRLLLREPLQDDLLLELNDDPDRLFEPPDDQADLPPDAPPNPVPPEGVGRRIERRPGLSESVRAEWLSIENRLFEAVSSPAKSPSLPRLSASAGETPPREAPPFQARSSPKVTASGNLRVIEAG
jgi:hypothetical protein